MFTKGQISSNDLGTMKWVIINKFGMDLGKGDYKFRFRLKKGQTKSDNVYTASL